MVLELGDFPIRFHIRFFRDPLGVCDTDGVVEFKAVDEEARPCPNFPIPVPSEPSCKLSASSSSIFSDIWLMGWGDAPLFDLKDEYNDGKARYRLLNLSGV